MVVSELVCKRQITQHFEHNLTTQSPQRQSQRDQSDQGVERKSACTVPVKSLDTPSHFLRSVFFTFIIFYMVDNTFFCLVHHSI